MKVDYDLYIEEFTRVQQELTDYGNKLFGEDRWRTYAELSNMFMREVKMQVNWSAVGSVNPEQAMKMAQLLTKAAELANNFKYNGYKVVFEEE